MTDMLRVDLETEKVGLDIKEHGGEGFERCFDHHQAKCTSLQCQKEKSFHDFATGSDNGDDKVENQMV